MLELKDATDYPKFCPNCGNRRQLRRELVARPVFVGVTATGDGTGDLLNGELLVGPLMSEWQSIDNCTRCGLDFNSIPDPATALTRKLLDLPDNELTNVMKLFYPNFHKLVSMVATKVGQSIGHVQRVLDGERKSAVIDKELVSEFRSRLEATGVSRLL